MKIPCVEHGAHFGDESVHLAHCATFWGSQGLGDLPQEPRQDLSDWLMELPSDKIYLESGWGIGIQLYGKYLGPDAALANDSAYVDMTDDERRDFQRNAYKEQFKAEQKKLKWRQRWPFKKK